MASLEVIEHVEDPEGFVSSLASLTRPGGMLTLSTINRTAKVSPNRSLACVAVGCFLIDCFCVAASPRLRVSFWDSSEENLYPRCSIV